MRMSCFGITSQNFKFQARHNSVSLNVQRRHIHKRRRRNKAAQIQGKQLLNWEKMRHTFQVTKNVFKNFSIDHRIAPEKCFGVRHTSWSQNKETRTRFPVFGWNPFQFRCSADSTGNGFWVLERNLDGLVKEAFCDPVKAFGGCEG